MSFDLLKGIFPIGGWVGPSAAGGGSPSFLEDKYFELLKDSGINLMYGNTEHNGSPEVMRGLTLCDKYGISYLVNDSRFRTKDFSEAEGIAALNEYQKHSSFVGIAVHDEPFLRDMESLRLARQRHKKVFEKACFHTNLFPIYCDSAGITMCETHENSSYEEYVRYIETYIDCANPDHLSYDFYPFKGKENEVDPVYFENMEFIRAYAEKLKVPYWCFIQVTSWHKGVIRNTTEKEIRWQVFTSLAYGSKGINYFTFCTPIDCYAALFDEAMLDRKGRPTPSYYYVQNVNKRLIKIGKELLYAEHKAIIPPIKKVAPIESPIARTNCVIFKDVCVDTCLTGIFEKDGEPLYFICNTDFEQSADYKMIFEKNVKLQNVETGEFYEGDAVSLCIPPADGVLLKIKHKEIENDG